MRDVRPLVLAYRIGLRVSARPAAQAPLLREIDVWDIEGICDPERFFGLVGALVPDATHLYVEGTSIAATAQAVFQRHSEPGAFLPGRQTIWPSSNKYRCTFSAGLLKDLQEAASSLAQPELLDHLFIYRETNSLVQWHDAFSTAMLIADEIPEARVAALAAAFGLTYDLARF